MLQVLIFYQDFDEEEAKRIRSILKTFLENENEHFLMAWGVTLEKIE